MQTFYSQQGEDIFIYRNFINRVVPDGIFVELGAINGITYSNTKFFEDNLQFTGTLIEPTNQFVQLLRNRPECKCYNLAVNYTPGKVKFIGDWATAGMVDTMSESFRQGWHKSVSQEYYVDGSPIQDILRKSNIEYIDFMSIDVEGGEQAVLETFDFNIPVYLICIELSGDDKQKDDMCRTILLKQGFRFKYRLCINEFWCNKAYFRKDILYDNSMPKQQFNSVHELGNFPFLEPHITSAVEDALRINLSHH